MNHRWLKAYPGLPYTVRAAVIGGAYPYVYSLSNAPPGMTINAATGEIQWPNPVSNAAPMLTVRDSEGTQASASWTITVGAQGFRFIDAVNGRTAANGGTGTLANPWRTLADMRAASGTAGMITYFRAGTYTPEGLPAQLFPIPPGSYVFFDEPSHSVAWLAYPGDARPVIDFGHTPGDMDTPLFRMRGNSIYLDGLETTRSHLMAFQISNDGVGTSAPIFRRMHMHDTGPGIDGTNSAFIMFRTGSPMNDLVIQDSEFFRITGENCALKLYALNKPLIEDNFFHDTGSYNEAVIAIKSDIRHFTLRGNTLVADVKAIGGNMSSQNNAETRTTYGEIAFNNIRILQSAASGGMAIDLNQNSQAADLFIYRNTLQGSILLRDVDANDGPFRFTQNVIINTEGSNTPFPYLMWRNFSGNCGYPTGCSFLGTMDPSRVILSDNLTGGPGSGIVDVNGNLTPAYQSYLGTRGHQLGTGSPTPPPPPSASRCDVDASGSTTVVDVQLCVNQAVGTLGCTTGDIDLNGSCNVVDVQRIVNAALGGSCVTD